jgi:hypothetical protein
MNIYLSICCLGKRLALALHVSAYAYQSQACSRMNHCIPSMFSTPLGQPHCTFQARLRSEAISNAQASNQHLVDISGQPLFVMTIASTGLYSVANVNSERRSSFHLDELYTFVLLPYPCSHNRSDLMITESLECFYHDYSVQWRLKSRSKDQIHLIFITRNSATWTLSSLITFVGNTARVRCV